MLYRKKRRGLKWLAAYKRFGTFKNPVGYDANSMVGCGFLADLGLEVAVPRSADPVPGALGSQGPGIEAAVVSQGGVQAVAELVGEALAV